MGGRRPVECRWRRWNRWLRREVTGNGVTIELDDARRRVSWDWEEGLAEAVVVAEWQSYYI